MRELKEFSIRLKNSRKKANITQKEIASKIEVSEQLYQRYEAGTAEPRLLIAKRIATVLKVSLDYLIDINETQETINSLSEEEALIVDTYRKVDTNTKFRIIQFCMNERDRAERERSSGNSKASG